MGETAEPGLLTTLPDHDDPNRDRGKDQNGDQDRDERGGILRRCSTWSPTRVGTRKIYRQLPAFPEFVVDPLPELPWAAPAPPSVLGLVPVAEDASLEGDPEPDPTEPPEPFGAVAPPLLEDLAGELLECVGEVGWPPVALGTTVSY